MTEHKLQTAIYVYLRRALPETAFVTSIDAAHKADPIAGAIRKARGVLAGVPDIHITLDGRSLWLEIKTVDGRLSEAQERCHEAIRRGGGCVATVRSIGDVEFQLRQWAISLRAVTLTPAEIDARLAAGAAPKRASRARAARPSASQIARVHAARSRVLF